MALPSCCQQEKGSGGYLPVSRFAPGVLVLFLVLLSPNRPNRPDRQTGKPDPHVGLWQHKRRRCNLPGTCQLIWLILPVLHTADLCWLGRFTCADVQVEF